MPKKLKSYSAAEIELVQQLVANVQNHIENKIFTLFKYTGPRGARMFTLLLSFNDQDRFIHINGQILWKIAANHRKRKRSTLETVIMSLTRIGTTKEKDGGT
ncbi:hypothetical protein PS15p_206207 [Mucor circinelloides]